MRDVVEQNRVTAQVGRRCPRGAPQALLLERQDLEEKRASQPHPLPTLSSAGSSHGEKPRGNRLKSCRELFVSLVVGFCFSFSPNQLSEEELLGV